MARVSAPVSLSVSVLWAVVVMAGCGVSHTRGTTSDNGDGGGPCVDGTHRCTGLSYQACSSGAWAEAQKCDSACDPGVGCVLCVPGQPFCNGDTVTACNNDGTAGAATEKCPGGACVAGTCVDPCSMAGSEFSYIGCYYWPTVTANNVLREDSHFAVAVANPNDQPADVTVTRAGMMVSQQQVPANGLLQINLPWVDDLKNAMASALVAGGAYKLESSLPVTVYQFNPVEYEVAGCMDQGGCYTYTNDASLLLPQQTLTSHYIAVSRPVFLFSDKIGGIFPMTTWEGNYPGFIAVVGTESGPTKVSIKFSANTMAGSNGVAAFNAGQTGTFTINQGDVLQIFATSPGSCTPAFSETDNSDPFAPETWGYCDLPATDLTGTEITSDQHIAVFSGHNCSFVPYNRWACDHLEQQMFPLESWGKQYAVAKIQRNPATIPDLVRVVSGADNNMITFDPPQIHAPITLDRGKWLEFPVTGDFVATGTDAFLMVQFMVGQDYLGMNQGGGGPGDPAMSLSVPIEQYRTSYIFLAPATYTENYVNVTAIAGVDVMLDGASVLSQLKAVGTGKYAAGRVSIMSGTHTITSAQPFGIEVYGLAPYTSYMYPGGLDVKMINVQ